MGRRIKVDPADLQIGARISARRRALGISQRDLAARLVPPMSHATVSLMERGINRVSGHHVAAIAPALSLTADELLRVDRPLPPVETAEKEAARINARISDARRAVERAERHFDFFAKIAKKKRGKMQEKTVEEGDVDGIDNIDDE